MAKQAYKAVKVSRGRNGWGGPLVILPTDQRDKIVSVNGNATRQLSKALGHGVDATAGN